ncbi:ABC transporter permease [Nocardia sp. CDC159]|uniref:Transport permease protein n=1 Tax=Nocardia pulmonis TaxID=2951408 RepID=A0A9X2E7K7_9NOCA|nr:MULTISPECIES: ABC transporter permease [Nocardia]MCM6775219.1 ABC transporter permease [Nocardia pulmonis]MCM6788047.1 ABC transporter permease [Nocardia sp. CDC159]
MATLTVAQTADERPRAQRIDRRPRVTRIGVVTTVRQSLIMALRGLLTFKRSPQLLYDAALLPIVGPVLFGNIFGTAIAGSVHAYLPTLIPGVLVQIVLTASVATGVQLCEDIRSGVQDRFASMPMARLAPIIGALTAGVTRYAIAATTVVIVGFAMGYRPAHPWGLIGSALLVVGVTAALSWIFAAVGVTMSKPTAVQGISALILMLFTFASNALVPTAAMPNWLRHVSDVNPVSHLVSAVRTLADDGRFGSDAVWSVVGALVVLLVFAPVTMRALRPR